MKKINWCLFFAELSYYSRRVLKEVLSIVIAVTIVVLIVGGIIWLLISLGF